ncbi:Scr1 family TA system antitoxin-like transcriptional regulator [Streptomyces mirabilis]
MPGCLQTPGYATALLTSIAAFRGTTDDISEAVEACMRRNSVIREGARRRGETVTASSARVNCC